MRSLPPKLRRLGFVTTMACGLSLLGIGVAGVAAIDERLEAASSGPVDVRFIDYRMDRKEGQPDRGCRKERESDRKDRQSDAF
jgi:hypothetical protein